jgi:nitroimidazol reductase NimA-like FMN-containing flavoprotein (pyridoxamine 5'-phosphate oxidase superfamily)
MFRKMLRKKQQLSQEECIRILKSEMRGVLSVLGDDDYPYALPINYWYCEEDGNLYFHCGKAGHKLDALRRHDKVSFCVYDAGYRNEGEWALNIRSVIAFGRMEIIDDVERVSDICRRLSLKYTSDTEYIESEIKKSARATLCLKMHIEHMSGKTVNES